ncbi:tetratricopeptide repeat protein [Flavobacterium sp. ZB4R12]|uniref:tetratricopeptide repeat protein n=1 Tax=Flavobacterium sp. ZB4R12 TaxID=3398732 RepID=UPI003AAD302E
MNKIMRYFICFFFIPFLLWVGIIFLFTIGSLALSKFGIISEDIYYKNTDAVGWTALPFCVICGIKFHYDLMKENKTSKQRDEKNVMEHLQREIKRCTESIEIYKPAHASTYYSRGNAKFHLQDYQSAIEDYTKAIEVDPNYGEAYYRRGFVMHSLKHYLGAITDYSKAIEIYPNYASAYYYRGNAKRSLQDYRGAIQDYTKAIKLDRHFKDAYKNRGIAKYHLRNYLGSIADYTRSIDPNHNAAKLEKEQESNNIFNRNRNFKG